METNFSQSPERNFWRERSIAKLDKINNGLSVMAVIFLIFRRNYEHLNNEENQDIIRLIKSCISPTQDSCCLEELTQYLHTLNPIEFSNLVKQIILLQQNPGTLSSLSCQSNIS